MASKRRPGVVFQPHTYSALQRGVHQMVCAVQPTLGPITRYIAIESAGKRPEVLDNSGIIARRIIELPDRDADMGAMYIRNVLWCMHEEVGDGVATTAVLFRAILDGGLRYVAAGGNAMLLRRHLESGLHDILDALHEQMIPLQTNVQVTQLAHSLCNETELADMLGEVLDVAGEYGRIEVRKGHSRHSYLEFVNGTYWDGGLWDKQLAANMGQSRIDLEDTAILVTDLEFDDPDQLLPVARTLEYEDVGPLVLVAKTMSEKSTALLHFINRRSGEVRVVAVKPPGMGGAPVQNTALDDLAVLTGARVFTAAAGDTLEGLSMDDLGSARQVWADRSLFGIVSGKGDARRIYDHIVQLKALAQHQTQTDDRRRTLHRLGQLLGGTVTVWVGGTTERDIEARKDVVQRTINALRYAYTSGVVPGGGVALMNCQAVLHERLQNSADSEQRAAYRILLDALQGPTRAMLENAGQEVSTIMAEIQRCGDGYGCDMRTGNIVDMVQNGIIDVAAVSMEAIRRAVTGAALLMTTDALVHVRQPEEVMTST